MPRPPAEDGEKCQMPRMLYDTQLGVSIRRPDETVPVCPPLRRFPEGMPRPNNHSDFTCNFPFRLVSLDVVGDKWDLLEPTCGSV